MTPDGRTAIWIGAFVLLWSAFFHHTRDWNTASRLLLTYAIVQNGSVEVTPFVAVDGRLVENPPTRDLASPDRLRYFSDKAPGQSFIGAAFLAAFRAIGIAELHPTASDRVASRPDRLSLRRTDWLLTIATSGLAAALSSSFVFLMLRRLGVGPPIAACAGLALAFASPMQAYSSLYYGHTLAGMFAIASLGLFDSERPRPTAAMLAGLFAGFAVVVEYTMATFVATLLVVGAASGLARGQRGDRRRWNALAFLLGGLGPAILLGWYHWRVTGDPFTPAYRYEIQPDFAAVHAKGGGIPLSSIQPGALYGLLFDPKIGLFWFAPAVICAVPGLLSLLRSRTASAAVIAGTSMLLLVAVACFPNWNGGLATGPRFLVPILPLLFLGVGWGWHVASRSIAGRTAFGLFAPLVLASGLLVTSMNVAGARKPFADSTADFLRAASSERERNVVDWVLNPIDVRTGFSESAATLAVFGLFGCVVVLRSARQDV